MIQPLLVFGDWGILIARVILGLVLVIHGWPKIKNLKGTAEWMGQMFKPGILWATVVALIEFVGGLLLIFGFLTQIVAALVAIEFVVIILRVKWSKGFVGGYEFDLLILATAIFLATVGGGIFNLDDFLGLMFY